MLYFQSAEMYEPEETELDPSMLNLESTYIINKTEITKQDLLIEEEATLRKKESVNSFEKYSFHIGLYRTDVKDEEMDTGNSFDPSLIIKEESKVANVNHITARSLSLESEVLVKEESSSKDMKSKHLNAKDLNLEPAVIIKEETESFIPNVGTRKTESDDDSQSLDEDSSSIFDRIKLEPGFLLKNEELLNDPLNFLAELNGADEAKREKRRFLCRECNIEIPKTDIKKHRADFHGGKFSCDQCEFTAMTAHYVKVHREAVHEGITYPCDQERKLVYTEIRLYCVSRK